MHAGTLLQIFLMATGATTLIRGNTNTKRAVGGTLFGIGALPFLVYNQRDIMKAAMSGISSIPTTFRGAAQFLFKEAGLGVNHLFSNLFYNIVGSGISYGSWQLVKSHFEAQDKLDQVSLRRGIDRPGYSTASQTFQTLVALGPLFAVLSATSPIITASVLGVAAAGKMLTRFSNGQSWKDMFDRDTIPLLIGTGAALLFGPLLFSSGFPLVGPSIIAASWALINKASFIPFTTANYLKHMEAENAQLQAQTANLVQTLLGNMSNCHSTVFKNITGAQLQALVESLAVLGELPVNNKLNKAVIPVIVAKYCKQHLTGIPPVEVTKISAAISAAIIANDPNFSYNPPAPPAARVPNTEASCAYYMANPSAAALPGGAVMTPDTQNALELAKNAGTYGNITMDHLLKSPLAPVQDALKGGAAQPDLTKNEQSKTTKMFDAMVAGIDDKIQKKEEQVAAQKAAAKAKAKGHSK